METFRKLVSDAKRCCIAGAGGVSDFNQAGGDLFGHAKGEPCRPAHGDMRRLTVNQDRGRIVAKRSEMNADQFDFAEGQSGGRDNAVNAGLGENLRDGMGARTGHFFSL
jgi:hypothetical protein